MPPLEREFIPNITWCIDGVITLSMFCTPVLTAANAVVDIEIVRSAITAMSIGLDASVPQPPLQATEVSEPVEPSVMPIAGANPNGTIFSSDTSIALQMSPWLGTHGIAQILAVAPQARGRRCRATYGAEPGLHAAGMNIGSTTGGVFFEPTMQ